MDPQAIVLDKLQNDVNYYGEYGKQFLSYSDIIILLKSPDNFKKKVATTKPMLEGSYFHTAILEPNRIKEYKITKRSVKKEKFCC